MERIAKETGRLNLDATDSNDLKAQFRRLSQMLRAWYDLGYSSSNTRDDSFRKIELLAKREGHIFRHKTGYFAREN